MPRYRSRLEIIADILNAVGDGAKKTRIMYVANLSHKLLEKYLKKTVEAGLIRANKDYYEVTEKGRVFLERFGDFSSRYSKIEREFEEMSFEREVLERMCELAISNRDDPRRRRR
ncbi:MAG: winged helix-turn-helix domain-containing protein [Candidatus Bathyarchaeota archaeon]|nr:winged helix-turn-helix domain-containing protein [Candidatus Bathyarchaeota archaeon]